jgi:hypothetical protein
MPTDPDQRQPWHTTFARVVNNKVAAGDSRVTRGKMIQLGISGDVYIQQLLGVPRGRLTHMYTFRREFEPYEGAIGVPNPCSSINDQLDFVEDDYFTVDGFIHAGLGGCNHYNSQPLAEQEGAGMTRQGMNDNIISRETEWILTATPVVVHSGISYSLFIIYIQQ